MKTNENLVKPMETKENIVECCLQPMKTNENK